MIIANFSILSIRICMIGTHTPFDWNQARAFLVTAQAGSFSAAARALGLTQPTLSRQVAALEDQLGITLFSRMGHTLVLTDAGREVLEPLRAMGEAATMAGLQAAAQSGEVAGRVSITATDVMAAVHLPAMIRDMRMLAPGLELEVVARNDIQDLMRREADIAIRHVQPVQPDLIVRKIGEASARLYAAPALLEQTGQPTHVDALAAMPFVGFGEPEQMPALFADTGMSVVSEQFAVFSQNGMVVLEMLRQGLGVSIMSDAVAAEVGGLVPVLPDQPPVHFPIWLVSHRELHTAARYRFVFDQLAAHLTAMCKQEFSFG